jgi:hypothetical protein
MKKIEYKKGKPYLFKACPYGFDHEGLRIMAGSMACQRCQYFVAKNNETHVVVCDFPPYSESCDAEVEAGEEGMIAREYCKNEGGSLITRCPIYTFRMVGSCTCTNNCPYFVAHDREAKIVVCDMKIGCENMVDPDQDKVEPEQDIDDVEYVLVEDRNEPDSRRVFEYKFHEITGIDLVSFTDVGEGERSEDGSYIEWTHGWWKLEYKEKEKIYCLKMAPRSAIISDSYSLVTLAMFYGKPVYSVSFVENKLVYTEVYVSAICPVYFEDIEGKEYRYEQGWYPTRKMAIGACKTIIDKEFHSS